MNAIMLLNVAILCVKGIVSRDFGVLYLILLNRYEPPNMAG
jgi:hypothetical protein